MILKIFCSVLQLVKKKFCHLSLPSPPLSLLSLSLTHNFLVSVLLTPHIDFRSHCGPYSLIAVNDNLVKMLEHYQNNGYLDKSPNNELSVLHKRQFQFSSVHRKYKTPLVTTGVKSFL